MSTVPHNAQFEQRILGPLRALARTLKRNLVIEGLCACAAMFVAVAAAHLLLDKLLHLGLGPRIALLLLVAAFAVSQLWRRLLRPSFVRVGLEDIAAVVERKHPELRDELISAVAFAGADKVNPLRDSPAMVAELVRRSAERVGTLPLHDILRPDRHRRHLMLGLAAAVAVLVAGLAARETIATYIARDILLRDVAWPSNVRLTLTAGNEPFVNRRIRWPVGDELTLVATAHDEVPDGLRAEFELAAGERAVRAMDRRGRNQFVVDYGPFLQSMRVRLLIERLGVDEATDWYAIEAIERPSIRDVTVHVRPPAYTDLQPFDFPAGQTSGDVLRQSSVRISAGLSKPVAKAALTSAGRVVAAAEIEPGDRIATEFVPQRTATYQFDLIDEEGLTDLRPLTYSLRVVNDAAPKVRLTLPGVGELVLANAILSLQVDAEDNLGLQGIERVHRVTPADDGEGPADPVEGAEPVPDFTEKQTRYEQTHPWPLMPLTLTPGERLTVQIRATDYQPPLVVEDATETDAGGRPIPTNVGLSVAYTLRVVTRGELLADLGRREHEWRREFEQIIKAQEQLNTRVRDLRDDVEAGRVSAEAAVRYGREGRTQRQQAGRLKTVRTQFDLILAEHRTNQVATPVVRRRLGDGVVVPMNRLISADIIQAADLIERLRRRFDPQVAEKLEQAQAQIVRTMYDILANMLKWEGYNEAVVLLQDIVRLQGEVNKQTRARLQRQIDEMFGTAPTSQPEDRP